MAQDEEFGRPALARGSSGPYGKYDEEIKIHIDAHTKALIDRAAYEAGVPIGELGREIFYLYVHGALTHELSAQRMRTRLLAQGADEGLLRRAGGGK